MVTIPLSVSDELAQRLHPHEDRLAEILELGLRHYEGKVSDETEAKNLLLKAQMWSALAATGRVRLPTPMRDPSARVRYPPIKAGGPPASEMIIAERKERK